MLFDFKEIPRNECYKLLVSTVTPRPIAWVVTQSSEGSLNVGAFSFFNAMAGEPPVVAIGMGSHKPGRPKDTRVNIRETGQFVVNLVSEENAAQMNITAIEFDYGIDELQQAGLTPLPSARVKPPRIAESPVSMECELLQIVEVGENGIVLGRVVAMHVRDEMVLDAAKYYIDTPKLKLIGRMHGRGWYARTSDLFEMPRIPVSEWKMKPVAAPASKEKGAR
ncbi:MAG TPA: flavin reductase family protein [Candidatus Acidoferrales bacterium]|nr:flavin reductase family protein [Candidatus Acidoferrales bacterium]